MDISILCSWPKITHVERVEQEWVCQSETEIETTTESEQGTAQVANRIACCRLNVCNCAWKKYVWPSYIPFLWKKTSSGTTHGEKKLFIFLIRHSVRDHCDSKRDNCWSNYRGVSSCTELCGSRRTSGWHLRIAQKNVERLAGNLTSMWRTSGTPSLVAIALTVELLTQINRLNSYPKSWPTATSPEPSAAALTRALCSASSTDVAMSPKVLLHCFSIPPSTTITLPLVDLLVRRNTTQSESENTSAPFSSVLSRPDFQASVGYLNKHHTLRFMRVSPLALGSDIWLRVSSNAHCTSIRFCDKKFARSTTLQFLQSHAESNLGSSCSSPALSGNPLSSTYASSPMLNSLWTSISCWGLSSWSSVHSWHSRICTTSASAQTMVVLCTSATMCMEVSSWQKTISSGIWRKGKSPSSTFLLRWAFLAPLPPASAAHNAVLWHTWGTGTALLQEVASPQTRLFSFRLETPRTQALLIRWDSTVFPFSSEPTWWCRCGDLGASCFGRAVVFCRLDTNFGLYGRAPTIGKRVHLKPLAVRQPKWQWQWQWRWRWRWHTQKRSTNVSHRPDPTKNNQLWLLCLALLARYVTGTLTTGLPKTHGHLCRPLHQPLCWNPSVSLHFFWTPAPWLRVALLRWIVSTCSRVTESGNGHDNKLRHADGQEGWNIVIWLCVCRKTTFPSHCLIDLERQVTDCIHCSDGRQEATLELTHTAVPPDWSMYSLCVHCHNRFGDKTDQIRRAQTNRCLLPPTTHHHHQNRRRTPDPLPPDLHTDSEQTNDNETCDGILDDLADVLGRHLTVVRQSQTLLLSTVLNNHQLPFSDISFSTSSVLCDYDCLCDSMCRFDWLLDRLPLVWQGFATSFTIVVWQCQKKKKRLSRGSTWTSAPYACYYKLNMLSNKITKEIICATDEDLGSSSSLELKWTVDTHIKKSTHSSKIFVAPWTTLSVSCRLNSATSSAYRHA